MLTKIEEDFYIDLDDIQAICDTENGMVIQFKYHQRTIGLKLDFSVYKNLITAIEKKTLYSA